MLRNVSSNAVKVKFEEWTTHNRPDGCADALDTNQPLEGTKVEVYVCKPRYASNFRNPQTDAEYIQYACWAGLKKKFPQESINTLCIRPIRQPAELPTLPLVFRKQCVAESARLITIT